jgi:hypothetical protein
LKTQCNRSLLDGIDLIKCWLLQYTSSSDPSLQGPRPPTQILRSNTTSSDSSLNAPAIARPAEAMHIGGQSHCSPSHSDIRILTAGVLLTVSIRWLTFVATMQGAATPSRWSESSI